jgi:hypothetical protein
MVKNHTMFSSTYERNSSFNVCNLDNDQMSQESGSNKQKIDLISFSLELYHRVTFFWKDETSMMLSFYLISYH